MLRHEEIKVSFYANCIQQKLAVGCCSAVPLRCSLCKANEETDIFSSVVAWKSFRIKHLLIHNNNIKYMIKGQIKMGEGWRCWTKVYTKIF